jgi:uncharacterized protein (DUF1684 family)
MLPLSYLQLADYRRQVFEMYARVRRSHGNPEAGWQRFRADQDNLFKTHPQTALTPEQVEVFSPLRYYPYDPAYRFTLPIEPLRIKDAIQINLQEDGPTRLLPFGRISCRITGQDVSLTLFWIIGYGGGIFLPFQDLTSFNEAYAGGRYLLDTTKGADLGWEADRLVIDFNFAYNPSCAYSARWHCPLPPPDNQLPVPIRAGELRYP